MAKRVKLKQNPTVFQGFKFQFRDARGRFASPGPNAATLEFQLPHGKAWWVVDVKVPRGEKKTKKNVLAFLEDVFYEEEKARQRKIIMREQAQRKKLPILDQKVVTELPWTIKRTKSYVRPRISRRKEAKRIKPYILHGFNHIYKNRIYLDKDNLPDILKFIYPTIYRRCIKIIQKERLVGVQQNFKIFGSGEYNRHSIDASKATKSSPMDLLGFSGIRYRVQTRENLQYVLKEVFIDFYHRMVGFQSSTGRKMGYLYLVKDGEKLYLVGWRYEWIEELK